MKSCKYYHVCPGRYRYAMAFSDYSLLLFETAADVCMAAAMFRSLGSPCEKVFRIAMGERETDAVFDYATGKAGWFLEVSNNMVW